jgi:hypothetical protein
MPFYNCYHSVAKLIRMTILDLSPLKDEAIAIAKTMTTNPISDFDYEGDKVRGLVVFSFSRKCDC